MFIKCPFFFGNGKEKKSYVLPRLLEASFLQDIEGYLRAEGSWSSAAGAVVRLPTFSAGPCGGEARALNRWIQQV